MLPELMTILKNAGFKMNVVSIGPFYKTPMFHSEVSFGMDMQLNIFCTREN
jgi:cobyrinic acid a,c-diamide synthase